ncbi:hypothetical protein [Eudoraea chungangensis]|uniref:hypothetical protein n=1 Tax=Eudoraea chungangensis TaxID=1481905 RepID=UPI0023EDFBDE|nr:hypothetical protein [Eudoraea chungangensis]
MKRIVLGVIFMLGLSFGLYAQLDKYKYVIVPVSFNGFKKDNQYKTSTLIKHLFTKKGFEVYYDNNIPFEINADRCSAVTVDLVHSSNMFYTGATLVLKDCTSKEVYTTQEGKSKAKDVEKSYHEAIEGAFVSIMAIPYAYTPSKVMEQPLAKSSDVNNTRSTAVAGVEEQNMPSNEPEKAKEAVSSTVSTTNSEPTMSTVAVADASTAEQKTTPPSSPVQARETTAVPAAQANTTKSTAVVATSVATVNMGSSPDQNTWYAQEIPNGYQLVDKSPKVRLKIYKTETADMYIAESEETNGVVYKREGKWFFEYYESGKKKVEELFLKF